MAKCHWNVGYPGLNCQPPGPENTDVTRGYAGPTHVCVCVCARHICPQEMKEKYSVLHSYFGGVS